MVTRHPCSGDRDEPSAGARDVVSLFSGIGALDLGLERAGWRVRTMCESWEPARRVLDARFPDVPIHPDVTTFTPDAGVGPGLLAAGFPCTDLSHAGSKIGIFGERSGLVRHVFRIVAFTRPEWVLLENVPNLLTLHSGAGMRFIADEFEALGYSWAYRTIDSRAVGVPQRRPRVIILASRAHQPASHLLTTDAEVSVPTLAEADASGFYWTEGRHGLGLVAGATPTLKGGSTLGLPSAPAVWFPSNPRGRKFLLPDVAAGEQLQGLPIGWTDPAQVDGEVDFRWKLIGNAVTSGVGELVGRMLLDEPTSAPVPGSVLDRTQRWPPAGWGSAAGAWTSAAGPWPERREPVHLSQVVDAASSTPLSHRATTGFLKRLDERGRQVDARFYADLEEHQQAMRADLDVRPWKADPATTMRMRRQKQRDTTPELRLRRALHGLGLRYRLQVRPEADLRTRLDVVFSTAKVAVDIRGCFWHACPEHSTKPRANAERWAAKLAGNRERDARNVAALEARGWHVVVVWEHDDATDKAAEIAALVNSRRPQPSKAVR